MILFTEKSVMDYFGVPESTLIKWYECGVIKWMKPDKRFGEECDKFYISRTSLEMLCKLLKKNPENPEYRSLNIEQIYVRNEDGSYSVNDVKYEVLARKARLLYHALKEWRKKFTGRNVIINRFDLRTEAK